ncbi:hypothetical protein AGMMS50239_25510 [Bacteroidia bacterium]|nr:hypothetical protein AGMMS50239_25510 [Bacteroidia bacterium]
MSDTPKGISKEKYFFFLDNNIPYEGYVIGLGYVLKEVVIVGTRINKYNDHFLSIQNISVCVVDNTRINTQQRGIESPKIDSMVEQERKKNEMKKELTKLVNEYYQSKINAEKFGDGYNKRIEMLTVGNAYLKSMISDDTRSVSTSNFPTDFFYRNSKLVTDFVRMRSMSTKKYEPSSQIKAGSQTRSDSNETVVSNNTVSDSGVSASGVITNSSGVVSTVSGIELLNSNYKYLNSLAENGQFLGMKNGALTVMDNSFLGSKRMMATRGIEKMNFLNEVNRLNRIKGIGNAASFLSVGLSSFQFAEKPNLMNGIDLGISVASYFYWPVGAIYLYGNVSMQWSQERQQQVLQIEDMSADPWTKAALRNTLPMNPTGPCP